MAAFFISSAYFSVALDIFAVFMKIFIIIWQGRDRMISVLLRQL